jgi:hypothetical protein
MESGSEEPLFFALTACSLITANRHKTPLVITLKKLSLFDNSASLIYK